jgi:4-amino-4-deoxy-L-arabinose transferase-like glycosyltransferase
MTPTLSPARNHARSRWLTRPTLARAAALLAILFCAFFNLARVPAMQWDEGWTMTVARTWVEREHYGRLLLGQPAPPGLEAALPVTGAVALSFRLFGVGVWQGRLAAVAYTLGALALLYALARLLYDRRIGAATLAVAILMAPHMAVNPLLSGRMAMAELPMLFFLLAGYLCLFYALRRSLWLMLPAALLWGIGLATKAQPLPFWALSLAAPLLLAVDRGRRTLTAGRMDWRFWRTPAALAVGIIGALAVRQQMPTVEAFVLSGHTLPATPLSGLLSVTGLVWSTQARIAAVAMLIVAGLPTLTALCYPLISLRSRSSWFPAGSADAVASVRLALWVFAASWLGWFVCLSVGWLRYLFPAVFVGSIFTAAMLDRLTGGFDIRFTMEHGRLALRRAGFNRRNVGALAASILIAMAVPATVVAFARAHVLEVDTSSAQVAAYLNAQTPSAALIETYETELMFLLDRPYHYPPDQTNVQIIRRMDMGQSPAYTYDPLAADPDYLVDGPVSRPAGLYTPALRTHFRPVFAAGEYVVYQRQR